MSPYERLMAEELLTGTFGDAPRTPTRHRKPADADAIVTNPTSATVAAEHRRLLGEAFDGWAYNEPTAAPSAGICDS